MFCASCGAYKLMGIGMGLNGNLDPGFLIVDVHPDALEWNPDGKGFLSYCVSCGAQNHLLKLNTAQRCVACGTRYCLRPAKPEGCRP